MEAKLINSRITKINAERNHNFKGKFKTTTNIKINSIEKIKESKNLFKIIYSFEINYSELGKILIEGILFLSTENKTLKQLLKIKEEDKIKSPEYIIITNLILQKASIKAFELEEEIGLPLHIQLPTFSIKNK